MSRRRDLWAVFGAIVILLVAAWLDTGLIRGAIRHANATFSASDLYLPIALGSVATGGACLLVAWIASRTTALVGLLFACVGAFLVLLPWLVFTLGARRGDAGPVIPVRLARLLSDLYLRTDGPLHAVSVIGGAMLVAGLIALVRRFRTRRIAVPAPVVVGSAEA